MAIHKKTQNIAMFCGIAYLHDEEYLGPQGNNTRRQIVVLHEVENGRFDPMLVSLKFLEKNYSWLIMTEAWAAPTAHAP
jgi:hypothetical protein